MEYVIIQKYYRLLHSLKQGLMLSIYKLQTKSVAISGVPRNFPQVVCLQSFTPHTIQ